MSVTTISILIGVWVGVGLLTGMWLARHGHAALWTVVAVILGPLFIPIALERVERHPRLAASAAGGPSPAPLGDPRQDGLRVLVGFDGSPESRQALDAAVAVLGDRCTTLVLAEVISYDSADKQDEGHDASTSRLEAAAQRLEPRSVSCVVLAGPPADALRQFATERDIDLLVVGRRGQGLSKRLLGSVSVGLVKGCDLPVLIAGPVHTRSAPAVTGGERARPR